jgi:hypothetical protein
MRHAKAVLLARVLADGSVAPTAAEPSLFSVLVRLVAAQLSRSAACPLFYHALAPIRVCSKGVIPNHRIRFPSTGCRRYVSPQLDVARGMVSTPGLSPPCRVSFTQFNAYASERCRYIRGAHHSTKILVTKSS